MKCFRIVLYLFFFCNIVFHFFIICYAGIDFTEGNRINIRCFAKINEKNGLVSLKRDSLSESLLVYDEFYSKLKNSKKGTDNLFFTEKPENIDRFHFIVYAKTKFNEGEIYSLKPQMKINFLDVFYLKELNYSKNFVKLFKKQTKKDITLNIRDFENSFIWYSDLLDKDRVYIPIYGFMSIPSTSKALPSVYNSWKKEKKIWKKASDIEFGFYKILDYEKGFFLVAELRKYYDYKGKKQNYGIIGWIESKYIVLWRSRLYYHPVKYVDYYIERNDQIVKFDKSEEINKFYLMQAYPRREEFEDYLGNDYFENIDSYYKHFGHIELNPPIENKHNLTKICVIGSFSRKLTTKTIKNLKSYFLHDDSNIYIHNEVLVNILENNDKWSKRIAIPERVLRVYSQTLASDDIGLSDLQKLIIVNSLFSVSSIKESIRIYDHINKVLLYRTSDNLYSQFSKALTGDGRSNLNFKWNKSLSRTLLKEILRKRLFYLNAFNQSSTLYVYLNLNEIFDN